MMPSPQDDSMASSPSDGHVSLTHSMIRDISQSSMEANMVSPSSPVTSQNANSPAGVAMCNNNNDTMYSPPHGHHGSMPQQQQQQQVGTGDSNGLMSAMGLGGEAKKYQGVNSNNNNNNNYMINNNNNTQGSGNHVEYVHHHSPQMMVQHQQQQHQVGDYSQQMYGSARQVTSPRHDRSPAGAINSNNNSSHKISVKCAAELIHGGASDLTGGLRTSFKKEPEHRY